MSRLVSLCLLIALIALPAGAQPAVPGNPLLDMLSGVPQTTPDDFPLTVSYTDFRVGLEYALSGLTIPPGITTDQLDTMPILDALDPLMSGLCCGDMRLTRAIIDPDAARLEAGFSFFELDRWLLAGQPPSLLTLYEGRFDRGAIDAALTANGWERQGFFSSVWCSAADGCGEGMRMDISTRLTNSAIDDLGRRPPVRLSGMGDRITLSPDGNLFMRAAQLNADDSLAADPAYAALAESIGAQDDTGGLFQAQFMLPGLLEADPPANAPALNSVIAPVPLAVVGTRIEGGDEVSVIALAYPDEASATQAAGELGTRLQAYIDLMEAERADLTVVPGQMIPASSGQFVALAAVRAPLDLGEEGTFGRTVRLWLRMLQQDRTLFLFLPAL